MKTPGISFRWNAAFLFFVLCSVRTFALDLGGVDRPPLLEAAARGRVDTIGQLLDQGESILQTDAHGKTALITAAESGQTDSVRLLLSRGAPAAARDKFGASALSRATRYPEIVQMLIAAKAPVDNADNDFRTPLIAAAMQGVLPVVRILLENGANPNKRDHSRMNAYEAALREGKSEVAEFLKDKIRIEVPVVAAAFQGDKAAIEQLIAARSDVNAADLNGLTALHMAVWTSRPEIVHLLLEAGANPNRPDVFGRTPLHYAFFLWEPRRPFVMNPSALGLIEQLAAAGADLGASGKSDSTPLELASGFDLPSAVTFLLGKRVKVNEVSSTGNTAIMHAKSVAVARLLVDAGARTDIVNVYGQTVLSGCDSAELAKYYLDLGVSVHSRDINGDTPLMTTSSGDVARLLIARGADMNVRNNVRETVLMNAVSENRVDVVRVLVEKRVDVNNQDPKYGDYALKHAKSEAVALLLLKAGANPNLVDKWNRDALQGQSDAAIVRALIQHGVNVNRQDTSGETALFWAVSSGWTPVVDELVKARASLNLTNKRQESALFYARNPAIVSILMKGGIDHRLRSQSGKSALFAFSQPEMQKEILANLRNVDEETEDGEPYLHAAAAQDNLSLLRLLLDQGAAPGKRDRYNRTALFFARSAACAELLLARGVDANAPDSQGETVLFHRLESDIFDVLRKHNIDLNRQNKTGETAAMAALTNEWSSQFQWLIESGADVNQRDKNGRNALFYVRLPAQAELLLSRGIRVHVENEMGITALNSLACDGKLDIARALLRRSPDVNTRLAQGNTELTRAAQTGCPALVDLLLGAKADPSLKNEDGETALVIAERNYLNVLEDFQKNLETLERKNHFEQIYKSLKNASK